MKTGLIYPLGSFQADTWVKIYENTLSSSATSLTISGLNGDTDVEYKLETRIVDGASSGTYMVRPNNDSGTNYGYQRLRGLSSTIDAQKDTATGLHRLGYGGGSSHVSWAKMHIYAKSGYVRTAISLEASDISSSLVNYAAYYGSCWSNTADNITSLVIIEVNGTSNALGTGTYVCLWKRVNK